MRLFELTISLKPGQLCNTVLPSLQLLLQLLTTDMNSLNEGLFQVFIGDPLTYSIHSNWYDRVHAAFFFLI